MRMQLDSENGQSESTRCIDISPGRDHQFCHVIDSNGDCVECLDSGIVSQYTQENQDLFNQTYALIRVSKTLFADEVVYQ